MVPEAMPDRDLRGRTLGEYVLCERLDENEGSAGDVYRGEQLLLKRDVVVRVFHQRPDDGALQRFMHDAQLEHPYAAHVYAYGVDDKTGQFWIATEMVHGVTLTHWLATHGPMPVDQFVPFFECLAQVVQAAHDRGIVHGDLKPSNVMLLEGAGRLCPKLLGFGLDQLTRGDAGTDSPAADIHALGGIAYEALIGRVPVIADAQVPPLGGDFSPDLDRILCRALVQSPEGGHPGALELARELCTALRTSPHEQLRSAAQQWNDRNRAPGLLWGPDMLAKVQQWTCAPSTQLSPLECSFLADSERRVRLFRWGRRSLVAVAAILAVVVIVYRSVMHSRTIAREAEHQAQLAQERARAAQQVTDATNRQAELEQGRSALLHGEPDAQLHLGRAYQQGDHSPSTRFMYARALQPKLAELARFQSLSGRMWSAAFSPDSRQIVTTDDQGAQVWDAQTYRLLFKLPHGSTVYQAVYSADGAKLVTTGSDGAVRIWDAASGALVRELHGGSVRRRSFAVAMSSDGKLVAAIDTQGEFAHAWDAVTGALIAKIRNDASEFPALAFSTDGRWLATTGGNDVHVFDVQSRRLATTIRGPGLQRLAFDPTGPRLIIGAITGEVAIWAIPSGTRIRRLREMGEPVQAVAFSPDGHLVLAADRDGQEHVWQAGSGALQSQMNPRHSKIISAEFDQTSKLILAANADGTVVVADTTQGMPITVLEGPQNIVMAAHFDPSSRRIVGASSDGTARVWDATSPYRRWSSPPVSNDCGIATSPEPDGRFIAVGCRGHITRVWDTARDQLLAELPSVSRVDGDFTSAFPAVSGAGDRAAVARGNTVEVYALPGGQLLRTIVHGASVNAVAFAAAGRDIVSGAVDGSLLVTRDDGVQVVLPRSSGGIDAVELLSDGRVVVADAQRRIRIHDRGGTVLAELEIPMRVMSLRIDGTRLVTIPIYLDTPAPPLLLDLDRYRIVARLEGHVGRVVSARWVTGHQILTAGGDGTVRLWEGSTGQMRQMYQGGSRLLTDAVLARDGLVIAGSADGLLRFWDMNSGLMLWALQAHKSRVIGVHVEGQDIVTRGFSGELARWTVPTSEETMEACSRQDQQRCAIMQQ